jgi:TRAP transporter TAXI family solute receptor
MRVKTFKMILGAIALALTSATAFATDGNLFRIGTGGVGGTYYPIGQIIATAISNPLSKENCLRSSCGVPGLLAVGQTSNGSVANIEGVEEGRLESGFSQSDVAHWAVTGTGVYKDRKPSKSISAIASLYKETIHLVARKEARIRSVYNLVGKRVSLDDPGSGTLVDARIILDAYGISEEDIIPEYVKPTKALEKIRTDKLDAFFIVAGYPSKAIAELSNDNMISIINITGYAASKIVENNSFFSRQIIPAGTYNGIDEVQTLGVAALWVVANDISETRVYDITKAFWQNLPGFQEPFSHPRIFDIDLETAFDSLSVPLHPGAVKYYQEIGRLKQSVSRN